MNTLQDNDYTRAWRQIGQTVPVPKAVLAISAHWYIGHFAVTAMAKPRTIHDFYGFPEELFAFDYPAPGLPELAARVAEIAKPDRVGLDRDQWGIDHGTWSVLAHMFPQADIPVVQLSINAARPLEFHLELGARLSALRDEGVLILSSGNVVHNLRKIDWNSPTAGTDWARRFDETVRAQLDAAPGDIMKVLEHPDYAISVPTPDHFVPLLYTAGLARDGQAIVPVVEGYAMGSLSMTSYGVGWDG